MTMMAATTATRNRRPHTEMITAVARFTRSVSTRFQELTGPADGYNFQFCGSVDVYFDFPTC